jgi:murein L,D-transpeptidase YcbB/YkuD
MVTSSFLRRRFSLFVNGAAFAGAIAALLLSLSSGAAQAQFNPYRVFTDSGPVTQEEKDRRQAERDALRDRISPQFRMDVPFVSEASILGLESAIGRYRQIVAAGGWPMVRGDTTLRPGDSSAEIVTIRQHLVMEGDLPPGSGNSGRFDDEFRDGLTRFQIRNGLRVSGFLDQRTLKALNVPARERLRQLEANLPRV